MTRVWSIVLLGCLACVADRSSADPSPDPSVTPLPEPAEAPEPPASPPGVTIPAEIEAHLLAAAKTYRKWGRVDEQVHLAPRLCRPPTILDYGFPSHARISGAEEAEHGRKLYYLYAGAPSDSPEIKRLVGDELINATTEYIGLGAEDPAPAELPLGFTVVKQSWTVEPGKAPSQPSIPGDLGQFEAPDPIDWVETADGEILRARELSDLYVLYKAGPPDTPGTDLGWIYGTVDPSGTIVTSGGLIEQCMSCHVAAEHERLFGLQPTPAQVEPPSCDARAVPCKDDAVTRERFGEIRGLEFADP